MSFSRRLFQIVSFLLIFQFLIVVGHSTEILKEKAEITVNKYASARVTLVYRELSTEKISYLVPYHVQNFKAFDSKGKLNCDIRTLNIGTEFLCDPHARENYTVTLSFTTKEMISFKDKILKLTYQHSVVDPTKFYSVKVILPEGYVVYKSNESDFSSIDPSTGVIGSTGRRITVEWKENKVKLGKTLYFSVYYERVGFLGNFPAQALIPISAIIIISAFFTYRSHLRNVKKKEGSISVLMSALTDDEKRVLQFVIQHDKKCTQKEIVKELNLSKAKASRLICDLEKRDLIKKAKHGRTNIITIEKETGF